MNSEQLLKDVESELEGVSVPTLIQILTKKGLRTRFFERLKPISAANSRFVGEAFTIRSIPVREDVRDASGAPGARNPHRQALSEIGAGSVVVFDARGLDTVSQLGDIIARYLLRMGVRGVVTDGGVGDAPLIDELGLPVFHAASAPVPGGNRLQVVDWQVPIGCAGIAVYPGDIIVGDANGAVCIPRDKALEVARLARAQEHLEAFLMSELDAGAPLEGTYPPNPATLERYAAFVAANPPGRA
ncbi:MAG TPA: ribonuclease activity regulator RraA [Paraburkholderia sp.]|nr:ribonuclease activity regulator RraA [Paraburkholderia sp.]